MARPCGPRRRRCPRAGAGAPPRGYSHGVLATAYLGVSTSLAIARSWLDGSQTGIGLALEGGVTATLTDSSVSGNGSAPPSQILPVGGRGIQVVGPSTLSVSGSTVSDNHDGGILVDNTSPAAASVTVTDSAIEGNGTNGVIYGNNTQGLVARNVISGNGQRGSRGATTGFNGVEIQGDGLGWSIPFRAVQLPR
ncbi:MAG TPA: right-handed parallel beta-helix repeat-containing protein [Candidatus Binatia bacterium]|nr:right-handed parallel beta-helix repeat-containing protein [Candidatus Binatia bacterium]